MRSEDCKAGERTERRGGGRPVRACRPGSERGPAPGPAAPAAAAAAASPAPPAPHARSPASPTPAAGSHFQTRVETQTLVMDKNRLTEIST